MILEVRIRARMKEDHLETGGDHGVHEGVAHTDDQGLLLEERLAILQTDPGGGEQVPQGEGVVERCQGGHHEEDDVDGSRDQQEPQGVGAGPLLSRLLEVS